MNYPGSLREDAIAIWNAGVAAVDGRKLVKDVIGVTDGVLNIGNLEFSTRKIRRIVLVGFGKASAAMAVGFEQALGESWLGRIPIVGQINVPDDKVLATQVVSIVGCRPPGENLPTPGVIAGTDRILEFVRSAGPSDLCICLISGGGSALLEKPVAPITLNQFRTTTTFLSHAGASIYELNAVRRAISQVKGGRLGNASGGAPVISLLVSDVVGDNLDVIASGPTVEPADEISAIEVLKKFDPDRSGLPEAVWKVLESNSTRESKFRGEVNVSNLVIGNVKTAQLAARQKALELGYQVELVTPSGNEGDAGTVGRSVAIQIAQDSIRPGPICRITGGETTVTLCDVPGQGGRNQHLVLSALKAIMEYQLDPNSGFCLLSGGTDGEDGNVPVAGAWFDSKWISSINESEKPFLLEEINSSLAHCDSYAFFAKHHLLLSVANTFTNVCDLRIVLNYCPGT